MQGLQLQHLIGIHLMSHQQHLLIWNRHMEVTKKIDYLDCQEELDNDLMKKRKLEEAALGSETSLMELKSKKRKQQLMQQQLQYKNLHSMILLIVENVVPKSKPDTDASSKIKNSKKKMRTIMVAMTCNFDLHYNVLLNDVSSIYVTYNPCLLVFHHSMYFFYSRYA
jgi:hypothetical protein